jgi:putative ABC transport system ATP-binding protein
MLRVLKFKPHHGEGTLQEVDIEVIQNNRVSFKAPSGFGKSSLLHAILGLSKHFHGNILWEGVNIKEMSETDWAYVRSTQMSYVPQGLDMIPHFTVEQNIRLNPQFETGSQSLHQRAKQLRIEHLFNKRADRLSFGERQRACLLRSLVRPFDLLLLDEPFSHLDEVASEACSELIDQELKARNAALILTSHKDIPERLKIDKQHTYA